MSDLSSESNIMSRAVGDWNKPLVTFLCTSYNQEDYIEQTIIGFLSQKTSFPYEILIHDDKSTDNTKSIIESYRLRYPKLIKCIYQSENQYSKGESTLLIAGLQSKGKYVALCEGDDYWINENKIENQVNLMINDDSISMVLSPGKLERNGKLLKNILGFYGNESKEIFHNDILSIPGQFAPTASYVVKKKYLIESMTIFSKFPIDLFIELYCAVQGRMIYYPEVGSVYRLAAKNSWTENISLDKLNSRIRYVNMMEKMIYESKSIEGFIELDWSIKLSAMYFNLATIYLKKNNIVEFKKNINISHSYNKKIASYNLFFHFRYFGFVLNKILLTKKIIEKLLPNYYL